MSSSWSPASCLHGQRRPGQRARRTRKSGEPDDAEPEPRECILDRVDRMHGLGQNPRPCRAACRRRPFDAAALALRCGVARDTGAPCRPALATRAEHLGARSERPHRRGRAEPCHHGLEPPTSRAHQVRDADADRARAAAGADTSECRRGRLDPRARRHASVDQGLKVLRARVRGRGDTVPYEHHLGRALRCSTRRAHA